MRLALGFCSILLSSALLVAPAPAAAQTAGVTGDGSTTPKSRPARPAYTLVEQVHRQQMLADGTTITTDGEETHYFDSQGRNRMEFPNTELLSGRGFRQITINDPVAGVYIQMDPDLKIARISHVQRHPVPQDDQQFFQAEAEARQALEKGRPKPTFENLGESTFLGYSVHGTRRTVETPIGAIGNDRPIRMVQETWTYFLPTSPHGGQGITMRSIIDDPRNGHTERTVTKLEVGEPDPSVFQVPDGYKIFENKPAVETAQAPQ